MLLYAPTFRKEKSNAPAHFDFNEVSVALNKRFGGTWILLIRNHYFVRSLEQVESQPDYVMDVSCYNDMQDLRVISDCLISDNSSCMWDFTFIGRPCFVYAEDMQMYVEEDRSFSIPISEWPYPICESENKLCQAILDFDDNTYREQVDLHHMKMRAYEAGNASEQLLMQIKKKIES